MTEYIANRDVSGGQPLDETADGADYQNPMQLITNFHKQNETPSVPHSQRKSGDFTKVGVVPNLGRAGAPL